MIVRYHSLFFITLVKSMRDYLSYGSITSSPNRSQFASVVADGTNYSLDVLVLTIV